MQKPNNAALVDHLTSSEHPKTRKRKKADTKGKQGKRVRLKKEADVETHSDEGGGPSCEKDETVDQNAMKLPGESHFVLDGGALLHRVVWRLNTSYRQVMQQYQSYVRTKYDACTIIFYRYGNDASAKDKCCCL